MTKSIIEMWSNPEKSIEYSKNAREHARKTHDKEQNFAKMQEIYAKIAGNTETRTAENISGNIAGDREGAGTDK